MNTKLARTLALSAIGALVALVVLLQPGTAAVLEDAQLSRTRSLAGDEGRKEADDRCARHREHLRLEVAVGQRRVFRDLRSVGQAELGDKVIDLREDALRESSQQVATAR